MSEGNGRLSEMVTDLQAVDPDIEDARQVLKTLKEAGENVMEQENRLNAAIKKRDALVNAAKRNGAFPRG